MEPIDYTLGVVALLALASVATLNSGMHKTGYTAALVGFVVAAGVAIAAGAYLGLLVCLTAAGLCGAALVRRLRGVR